jgi:hypothetical protein
MNKAAFFGMVLGLASVASGQPEASRPLPGTFARKPPAPLEAALDAYSEITGRTILRSSFLPAFQGFSADPLPADTNAAVALIESELRRHGIDLVPDGELFVRVMPAGWSNSPMAGFLATLRAPAPDKDKLPTGTVLFALADADYVLRIYAELRTRTIIRPGYLGLPPLGLKPHQALTRGQTGYALTVLLAVNGVAAVDDGNKFVQLVPVQDWSKIETHSPKPQPGAELLDPKEIPKLNGERPANPLNRLNEIYRRYFHDSPPWTPRPADQLAGFYAELTEQQAVGSKNYGRRLVRFEVTTPLTKEEVLYAIETTLKLDGLALTKVEGEKISVISLGEKWRTEPEKAAATNK